MSWLFERRIPLITYLVMLALLMVTMYMNEQQRRLIREQTQVIVRLTKVLQEYRTLCSQAGGK